MASHAIVSPGQLSAWVMLVTGGLWAGAILIFAVERVNLWRRMPLDQYVVDFRRSLYRVDPLLPILGLTSCAGAAVFAVRGAGLAALLAWAGVALIALVIVASMVIAEPINSRFRRLPEGQAPDRADRHRTAWRRFHAARAVVALAGFACLAAATTTGDELHSVTRCVDISSRSTPG